MEFRTNRDIANALAERIRDRATPSYAGAQFRVALAREGSGYRFVTASVVFRPKHVPSRPVADYGRLLFLEHWNQGALEAVGTLSKLLSGQAVLENYKITGTFNQGRMEQCAYPVARERWTGWRLTSYLDRGPDHQDLHLGHAPLLSPDLKPYSSPSHAVRDWVLNEPSADRYDSSIPNLNEVVAFLPDTRCRIIRAKWIPGKVILESEARYPGQIQLQFSYKGSKVEHEFHALKKDEQEVAVPDDARAITIYVVHSSGDFVTQVDLSELYASVGEEAEADDLLTRSLVDIARGEGEMVEFKPFLSPSDKKESELIETVIAFANTSGGRIYVGVRDRGGVPCGIAELRQAFKKHKNPTDAQAQQLRWLITNKVKPIPSFQIQTVSPFGEPVIVVHVEKSDKVCATHENQIYVRHGATNRRPDVHHELRRLLNPVGLLRL